MSKFSQHIDLRITYEMSVWLDKLVAEAGAESRSAMARSMLQTIMDEDEREHAAGTVA